MKLKISEEANLDLEKIWVYTNQHWSLEQADRYYNLLLDEIQHLLQYPYSGKDTAHIRAGYLKTRVKSHLIFYKVNSVRNELEVIRILHQRMDIENRLS